MNLLSIAGFTNLGYHLHARDFEPVAIDMHDRTVVVTGGTGGLGRAAATALAGLGARVIVVGRTPGKLEETARQLSGRARGLRADLSLMADIRALAHELLESESRIDVLINNVGVLLPEREETKEGLEKTLATNLAGHFLLTELLLPRLRQSAPSRIIEVSSGGMYADKIRPHDLQFRHGKYRGTSAYARTKRGQVILAEMWGDRLDGAGVVAHAMHPGWVETAGVADSLPTFNLVMKPLLRTIEQGADTMVWLAAEEEPLGSTGEFWFDRRRVDTHLSNRTRETPQDREALWQGLAEMTGLRD